MKRRKSQLDDQELITVIEDDEESVAESDTSVIKTAVDYE